MSAIGLAGAKGVVGDVDAGGRVRAVRGSLSQRKFAAAMGVHPNTLGRIERGERVPDLHFLKTLCRQYTVNARWLLLGEGRMRAGSFAPIATLAGGLREPAARAFPASDGVEIDEGLFGVILAAVEQVHADAGVNAPAERRGRVTAQIYLDVVMAADEPAARRAMVPAISASLARFLSTKERKPRGRGKS